MLSVDKVTVRLDERLILREVTTQVDAKELVGLLGPNGAGKTTLLRTVLGLLRPAAGTVRVADEPVERARHLLGYVPQRHEFAWDFPINVAEAVLHARRIRLGRRPGRADRAAVEHALERVSLAELARRPVGALSGGQRQRVLLARALAVGPRLLLLDEPFTGVDVPTQDLLTHVLSGLRADGVAILMTTHDFASAARLADRIILLNQEVVADGPPDEVRDGTLWLRAFGAPTGLDGVS
ncbi:manganese ABC transporter ATP-binding protein [Pilimelia terevasa]|uniref:Manganese ABC transporter ATP-binding protein n=1 Tax=Pilimelia terevasa TaxID=53372 RepID=A0A8J3FM19_9ACTN|nr:anchored repeat-type ABC transporter ATP-binding subunit [Pilimelia terevasa]GGK42177.1 manganese ABC transporter ATP-binding protein [Pilimelia terevasa]